MINLPARTLEDRVAQLETEVAALQLAMYTRPAWWTRAGRWIGRWLFRLVSYANAPR